MQFTPTWIHFCVYRAWRRRRLRAFTFTVTHRVLPLPQEVFSGCSGWPHSPLPPRVYKGLPAVCSPSLFVRGSGLVSPAIAAEERQRNVSPVHGDGERPQLQQTRYVMAYSLELSNHDFFAAVDCQSRVRGFVSRCCTEKSPPQILFSVVISHYFTHSTLLSHEEKPR